MIIRSKTINEKLNSLDSLDSLNICNNKNSRSFSDFEKLILCGTQKILTFGEYSSKQNKQNKQNKRKIIYYFYRKIANNKNTKMVENRL